MAEANALKTVFVDCGFDYAESILTRYREINEPLWEDLARGEVSKEDLQTLRFAHLFACIDIDYDVVEFNRRYLAELGKGTFLIEGAFEICREIVSHGKAIYIVTNGILATQEARIKHSLIKEYISDFFVSEFIGYQKPDMEYFKYVFSHIQKVSKDKILIIGDSLTADIQGGRNAGIDSCWFNESGKESHSVILSTYQIQKLSQIKEFI